MSSTENTQEETAGQARKGGNALLTDFGPVFLFMVVYNIWNRIEQSEALYIATGVLIGATLASLAWSLWKDNRVPYVAIVAAFFVSLFGGLTLISGDPIYVKIKPTFMNLLYATIILGGLAFGRNIWKMVFSHAFKLPDQVWTHLALRWGLFFIFLAGVNEFVWRNYSEAFWANFKFFGVLPLTLAFAFANIPITLRWHNRTQDDFRAGNANRIFGKDEEDAAPSQ